MKEVLLRETEDARVLVMGNEAIARGALEAGVAFVTAYPGTPSTEIVESLIDASRALGFRAYWSVNEKVAFDAATGASFANVRSMVIMKHVGVNVAADSLQQVKLIDIAGGFVLAVVDDPSGLSSNNEQDSRWYAKFAGLPALEPSDLTEAREMTRLAFDISEELHMPVIVRSVTRLAHMTGDLVLGRLEPRPAAPFFDSSRTWTPFPCLEPERELRHKLRKAGQVLERYGFDEYTPAPERIGLVGAGFAFNYAREAVAKLGMKGRLPLLKISTINPLPKAIVRRFLAEVDQVLVVEDVTSFLEEALKAEAQDMGSAARVHGRASGALPEAGETALDDVVAALAELLRRELPGAEIPEGILSSPERRNLGLEVQRSVPNRQIGFCAGCPHRPTYYSLVQALTNVGIEDPIIVGDIGCYTLGFYPPFSILQTMTSMGASMGTAAALAQLNPDRKVIAFIGDSTFYHAGMPGLLQIGHQQTPVLVVVMDNSVTGSTGQQPHPGTWQLADQATVVPVEDIATAFKIPHVQVVRSAQVPRLTKALEEALRLDTPAVVVSRQACVLEPSERWRRESVARVDPERCSGCLICIEEFGCPAFIAGEEAGKIAVDETLCNGCAACRTVCPEAAISFVKVEETR